MVEFSILAHTASYIRSITSSSIYRILKTCFLRLQAIYIHTSSKIQAHQKQFFQANNFFRLDDSVRHVKKIFLYKYRLLSGLPHDLMGPL